MDFKFYNKREKEESQDTLINDYGFVSIKKEMLDILDIKKGDYIKVATKRNDSGIKDLYLFKGNKTNYKISGQVSFHITIKNIIKKLEIEVGKYTWEFYDDRGKNGIKININNGKLL